MPLNLSQMLPRTCLKSQAPTGTLILVDRPIFCNILHPGQKNVWHFYHELAEKRFARLDESFLVIDDNPELRFNHGPAFFEHGSSERLRYSFLVGMYQERYYLIASNLESEIGPGSYFVD